MHRGCFARSAIALSAAALLAAAGCDPAITTGTVAPPKLGENLLAAARWEYSSDRGASWTARPPLVRGGSRSAVHARTRFEVADPSAFAALELSPGLPGQTRALFYLNDQPVPLPEAGMYYRTIPAIPPQMLRAGSNVLEARIGYDNRPPSSTPRQRMPDVRVALASCLMGLRPEDLRITTGPALGAMDERSFGLTFRTNMPAHVRVFPCGQDGQGQTVLAETQAGLLHRVRVRRPAGGGEGLYVLVADNGAGGAAEVIRAPAWPRPGQPFRFIALGDSRTFPEDWAVVAAAAARARAHLAVFSGDMVSRGRSDWEWDEQFFAPGRALLSCVPTYAVMGNHEERAPIFPRLFYLPGGRTDELRWSQEIAGVLLIGIDGLADWSPESDNAAWLEELLRGSQARFIFLFSHYPAWSSSRHGQLSPQTGLPREISLIQARQTIVPLLARYKATAFVVGHDHLYERSELPGPITQIISGGAGAPLRGKYPRAATQNPYSAVFASKLHYCLFEVDGDTCTMQALTPDGQLLDSRSWPARAVSATEPPVAARP